MGIIDRIRKMLKRAEDEEKTEEKQIVEEALKQSKKESSESLLPKLPKELERFKTSTPFDKSIEVLERRGVRQTTSQEKIHYPETPVKNVEKELEEIDKRVEAFKEFTEREQDEHFRKEEEKRKKAEGSRKRFEMRSDYLKSLPKPRRGESINDMLRRRKQDKIDEREIRRLKTESEFKHFTKLNENLIGKQDDQKTELTREQKLKKLRDAMAMPADVPWKDQMSAIRSRNWALMTALDNKSEKLKAERNNAINNAFMLFEPEIKSKFYKISIDLADFWGFNNDQKYMISKDQPKISFDWGRSSSGAAYLGYDNNQLYIHQKGVQSIYTLVDHLSKPVCEFLGEHILKNELFHYSDNPSNAYIVDLFCTISRLFILEKYYPKQFRDVYKQEILKAKEIIKNKNILEKEIKELERQGTSRFAFQSTEAGKKREYRKRIIQTATFIAATQYYNIKNLKPEERHRLLNMNSSEAIPFINQLLDPQFKQPKEKSLFSKIIHRMKTQNIMNFVEDSVYPPSTELDKKTITPQLEKLQDVQEKILRKEQREQDEHFKREEEHEIKKEHQKLISEDEEMREEEQKDVEREVDEIHKEDKEFMDEERKDIEKLKKEASE